MYVEEFIMFSTKLLKSKTNPKLIKLTLIIVGIEVNSPVKIIVLKTINFLINPILNITLL